MVICMEEKKNGIKLCDKYCNDFEFPLEFISFDSLKYDEINFINYTEFATINFKMRCYAVV